MDNELWLHTIMHLDREREREENDYRVFGLNSRSLLASKDTNIANNCLTTRVHVKQPKSTVVTLQTEI